MTKKGPHVCTPRICINRLKITSHVKFSSSATIAVTEERYCESMPVVHFYHSIGTELAVNSGGQRNFSLATSIILIS